MSHFFGYIRVSTVKQGEHGVSLHEQRDAVSRFAERHGLTIAAWFEECQTAAKRGRPAFTKMLRLLKQEKAKGVIIHKIDRSARNLKDWADLGELIDHGVEVHFANESLDLHTRGGRLSADIQAVVAADYIRNLREETRKGFYGRLKQGLYPLPAPLGYVDGGKGKRKEIDPVKGPLVQKAFELYATGRHSLITLGEELHRLGLRGIRGTQLSRNGLDRLLNNPFYVGLIRIYRTNETFTGGHEPLVSPALFRRVREVLDGKFNGRSQRHDFLFRRLLTCRACGYSLIGELQKGHVYYRCHSPACVAVSVREEAVEASISALLLPLQLTDDEKLYVADKVSSLATTWAQESDRRLAALTLQSNAITDRLRRLTDALIDGHLEKVIFEERKTALLLERRQVEDQIAHLRSGTVSGSYSLAKFLELASDAYVTYNLALPAEKRDLLAELTSNRLIDGKSVLLALRVPFQHVADRFQKTYSAPYRDIPRTWDALIPKLCSLFEGSNTSQGEAY